MQWNEIEVVEVKWELSGGGVEKQPPFRIAFDLLAGPQHGEVFAFQPGLDQVCIVLAAQLA